MLLPSTTYNFMYFFSFYKNFKLKQKNKGLLKYLNSIGFQTYSDIFDESYDEIESADERCKFILDEIKRVCSLSKRDLTKKFKNVHDISLHNQKLFLDESFIERYFSEIIDKL